MAQKIKDQKLRRRFLSAFVSDLIQNSYNPALEEKEYFIPVPEARKIDQDEEEPIPEQSLEPLPEQVPEPSSIPSPKIPQPENQVPEPSILSTPEQRITSPPPKQRIPSMLPPREIKPKMPDLPKTKVNKNIEDKQASKGGSGLDTLGKITPILQDPAIFSVECPGPNKNLLVNRAGQIQVTGITLTKEEIDSVMEDASNKSKIPLINGLFKAAIADLLMTAIVSESIGTRFILQKRYQKRFSPQIGRPY